MKQTSSLALTAITLAAVLTFSNCKKEQTAFGVTSPVTTQLTSQTDYALVTGDRINEIMKDVAYDSYSFSFEKPNYSAGITQTAYGADNYLAFVDPQDLICPDPIKYRFKRIPIWKRPNIVLPTCPDMAIDVIKLKEVQELLMKADPAQFSDLHQLQTQNGGAFLATKTFTSPYPTMQLDKIDGLTRDLNPESYLLLNNPGDFTGGFTRTFYGYADLNERVFKPRRTNLRDVLKPTLKGCFDPIILSIIRERLQRMDPVAFKELNVTPLGEDKSIGVLGFN
jgi:hypothetical protein